MKPFADSWVKGVPDHPGIEAIRRDPWENNSQPDERRNPRAETCDRGNFRLDRAGHRLRQQTGPQQE